MIENKYYVPDITEFREGFEFESNYVLFQPYTKRCGDGSEDWYKHTLNLKDHGWFWGSYKNDAYPTEFRVKYLDQEDIESFGFIQDSLYSYTKEDWIIEACVDDIADTLDIYCVSDLRFKGKIKNKSELQVLLKQLAII